MPQAVVAISNQRFPDGLVKEWTIFFLTLKAVQAVNMSQVRQSDLEVVLSDEGTYSALYAPNCSAA